MFSRSLMLGAFTAAALTAADLPPHVSTIEAASPLEAVFYRVTTFAANTVSWRKSPAETRAALTPLVNAKPSDAQLLYLRAREAELQLDFAAAEADLARYVQAAPNKTAAWLEKADYHHRRLEPAKEIAALLEARAFARAVAEANEQLLDPRPIYQAWQSAEPANPAPYTEAFGYLTGKKLFADAEALAGRYEAAFPNARREALGLRASLARARSGSAAAVAVYERAFRPDWPADLAQAYFAEVTAAGLERATLAALRQRVAREPQSLDAAVRLYWYFQQAGQGPTAQRALYEFRQRKNPTAEETFLLAELFRQAQNLEEAARLYSRLDSEAALAALAHLLLQYADQPIRGDATDLSYLTDIGTADRMPGLFNGLLSLVFNTTYPAAELATAENRARPYFQRARAADLVALFESRFPNSPLRAGLQHKVIEAFAAYNESDAVLRQGQRFLSAFPKAPERVAVSLLMADAYARKNQTRQEMQVYQTLLGELGARTPEYTRILDRAIARYVSLKQVPAALALLRGELDRHSDDPALYERLAAFLEQNRLGAEIEAVYRRAMQQFPERTWSHRLARWYLSAKMTAKYDALSKEVAGVFSGTDLEAYLNVTGSSGALGPVLFRQVNLYAAQRFPHHLPFVKNLIDAYAVKATADPAEWERLLRAHWIYDESLRQMFFAYLSRTNRLDTELTAVRAALPAGDAAAQTRANPTAATWIAEAELWRSHFETAAPYLRAVAAGYPADVSLLGRTAAVHRSLGQSAAALEMEGALAKAWPRKSVFLTHMGEIHADAEHFDQARPLFDQVARIAPGAPESWLESATLHWDYYQYDDALRQIDAARQALNNRDLFAYEAGAIYENKGQMDRALASYVAGALAADGDTPARRRLIRLARRQPVEAALAALPVNARSLGLRVALLEAQGRRADLEKVLTAGAAATSDPELLARLDDAAVRNALPDVQRTVLARRIALAQDPIDSIELRLRRVHFEQAQGRLDAARGEIDSLVAAHPKRLAVIRAAAAFYVEARTPARAVTLLRTASAGAYPALQRRLRLEAAATANQSGDPATARAIAAELLTRDPIDAEAIAVVTEAFGRAGDDRGLAAFYKEKLDALRAARQDDRVDDLRRSLISALARLKDHDGAVDQYIELLRRSPEDTALVAEAANYAQSNRVAERLLAYFRRAETDSPKDARWPVVRAGLETSLGNFPAAIEAWNRAAALRPERSDLLMSRATLETRLLRFDDVAATYQKLYDLTYHNPEWLTRLAEVRARQGRQQEAARTLRQALIDGRPKRPENHFTAAESFEAWGMLEEARAELETGLALTTEGSAGAESYGRILARLRQTDAIAARTPRREQRQAASTGAASAIHDYYTPEEKTRVVPWIEAQNDAGLARAAGLWDVAARRGYRALLARSGADNASERMYSLIEIQGNRGRHAELAQQLEAYWKVHPANDSRNGVLDAAILAARKSGATAVELRLLTLRKDESSLDGQQLERYLALRSTPDPEYVEPAINAALTRGEPGPVFTAIANAPRPPAWKNAYRALAALYFRASSPDNRKAFTDTLGPELIGERLAAPKTGGALTGDTWFYYAARYADYLNLTQDPLAAGYRLAPVESRGASALAFLEIGDYPSALALDPHLATAYLRQRDFRRALEEYRWIMDNRPLTDSWWIEAAEAIRGAGPSAPEADALLIAYVRRNGAYRVEPLVAALDRDGLVRLAGYAADPADFLLRFAQDDTRLLEQTLQLAQRRVDAATGDSRGLAVQMLGRVRIALLTRLVADGQWPAAAAQAARFSAADRESFSGELLPLEIRIAARTGGLAALLAREKDNTAALRTAAMQVRRDGDAASANQILAAAYRAELAQPNPLASSYLGLAEVLLDQQQPAEALALLDRLVLTVDGPFAHHAEAGRLLLQKGRKAEAVRFLEPALRAAPWNTALQLDLSLAKGDEAARVAVAADQRALYSTRVTAAAGLGRQISAGSRELDLLAAGITAPAEADQPYFVPARLAAAAAAPPGPARIRLLFAALATEPANAEVAPVLFDALYAANRWAEAVSTLDAHPAPGREEKQGDALRALGEFDRALALYQSAGASSKQKEVQEQVDRRNRNEARRPHVATTLEQPEIVQPRLLAGAQ